MSLNVFVAHSGARIDADATTFESLNALQQWIAKSTDIPTPDQILLTEKGRHVRLPALLLEARLNPTEIFLFDKALFATASSAPDAPQSPLPNPFEPDPPPDTLTNAQNLKSWEALFKARRDWTLDLVEQCASMADVADRYIIEKAVIDRCVAVATGNKDGFIRKAEARHGEVKAWFEEVAREQSENVKHWQSDLDRLEAIPARGEFLTFFVGHEKSQENGRKRTASLASFAERDVLRKAASRTRSVTDAFTKRIADLGTSIATVSKNYRELRDGMAHSQSQYGASFAEEPGRLMNEINAVARKVSNDYESVAALPQVPRSITQASKIAHTHTKQYLPAIAECACEMSDLVRRAVEMKNAAAFGAIERMQAIASIESSIGALNADLQSIELPQEDQEAFEQLSLPSRLPFAYGSLLIEGVRRAEWAEKMKKDSSSLAEEVAGYQEEEQRRRRKWLRGMADILRVDNMEVKALGVEINLLGEEKGWPAVTRPELEEYLHTLAQAGEFQAVADSLAQTIKDLDKPTRQQVKRVKTFKAGSIHEAGFGKGSLMLRGDDDMRVVREANARLEEELRGQKSRVRKLESLLHGQSQAGRISIGSGFVPGGEKTPEPSTPDQITLAASPKQELVEDIGRRASISSRRLSTNQPSEDKAMARRVIALEAQLLAEQARRADLEKEVNANRDAQGDARRQVEEANSIKKDIMENMEAQQKEFANERRSIEDELNKAKQRVEEVEDELDRVLGSRDTERMGADNKLQSLAADLDQVRKEAAEVVHKAENQAKKLREDLGKREQADADRETSLSELWSLLSPDQAKPEEGQQLLSELDGLARRFVDHMKDLEHAVAMAKSDNESVQTALDEQRAESAGLVRQVASLEDEARKSREELTTEKAKASSLEAELAEERKHLKELQRKFTEGETGTEALRRSLVEGENRAVRLSAQLADTQSHANSLDVELSIAQKKLDRLQGSSDDNAERLQQRSTRAKELTQRLYSQTDRLKRLLESLGFAITHQDDSMIIQRASKANTSAILGDPSQSLNRSISAPSTAKRSTDDMNLSMLNWMDKDDAEEESRKYAEYMSTLDKFDVHVFSEAISKRMRDIEHTARKWQKELRSYRDKTHKYQGEAHDKIAFRSFKPGDLALFLPTRNQITRPWAAFNVGAPHYFLREQDSHKLNNKEWLVARISKIEERVVDLSKTMDGKGISSDGRSIGETSEGGVSFEDDNPFDLSDGLRWYLLDAAEEKVGAPGTPGLGRAAAATSARVDARGSIRIDQAKSSNDAAKNLSRSLDSRRSSTNSKKSVPTNTKALADAATADGGAGPSHLRTASNASSLRPVPNDSSQRPANEDIEENQNGHDASPSKAVPSPAKTPLKSNMASTASSTAASPSKSVRSSSSASPTKSKDGGGLWNSLWKFDVNYESGGSKRKER